MHESGISSVQFSPASSTLVLTNGLDSCLKLVDVRTGTAVHTFRHADLSTAHSYSKAVLSVRTFQKCISKIRLFDVPLTLVPRFVSQMVDM